MLLYRFRRCKADILAEATGNHLDADRSAIRNSRGYRKRRKAESRNRKQRSLSVKQRPYDLLILLILIEPERQLSRDRKMG